jgi:ornithine cyclodeaminase/alanine dehydrogenase-like protein (mu-crystallin family)
VPLIVTERDIVGLYDIEQALETVERIFLLHREGKLVAPAKVTLWHIDESDPVNHLRIFPVAAPSLGYAGCRLRLVGENHLIPSNVYCLFEIGSRRPVMILFSDTVSRLGTAAPTGIATRLLAQEKSPEVGVFGTGRFSPAQLLAVSRVRRLKKVKVYSPNFEHVQRYCEFVSEAIECPIIPCDDPESAARGSNIILEVTTSTEPVISDEWLEEGAFITTVGSVSGRIGLDDRTIRRAKIVVESYEQSLSEQMDLSGLRAEVIEHAGSSSGKAASAYGERNEVAKLILRENIYAELGEIVAGEKRGREGQEIIWFKNVGAVFIDLATMIKVYELARANGVGQEIEMGEPSFPAGWGW